MELGILYLDGKPIPMGDFGFSLIERDQGTDYPPPNPKAFGSGKVPRFGRQPPICTYAF